MGMIEGLNIFKGRKILVAMSGGIDSAVAAVALRRAGAEVIGVHMRVWHYDDCNDDLSAKIATCCSPADADDARRVAEQFDFPFYSIDFQADFRRAVIDPFVDDYLNARTPNPCVACNSKLKLGTLLAKARAFGAEAVATGHFARVRPGADGRYELLRAVDLNKDQSYYLFELRQEQLRQFVMPLGDVTKSQVREMAREAGLAIADKAESQDICFVTDGDYRRFVTEEAGLGPDDLAGAIVDTNGNVLGRHGGIHNFTIGQRRGLGVSSSAPLYVVDLLLETQTVIVGREHETRSPGLVAGAMNWIAREPSADPLRVRVKIRYRHEAAPATLYPMETEGRPDQVRIEFDEPLKAVAPGQAAVCYDFETGQSVIAGGWIERRLDPLSATSIKTVG